MSGDTDALEADLAELRQWAHELEADGMQANPALLRRAAGALAAARERIAELEAALWKAESGFAYAEGDRLYMVDEWKAQKVELAAKDERIAELEGEKRRLSAHWLDRAAGERAAMRDRAAVREEIETLVEVLIPECQHSTVENRSQRMMLLSLRNILASNLQSDEEWAAEVWAVKKELMSEYSESTATEDLPDE